MKLNIFSFLIAIFLFVTTLNAQTDTAAQNKSPFAKGTKALLFQISNNFTLRSFEGGLISFKRHFSEKNALRIGISFSGNHDEYKQQRVSHPSDTLDYHQNNMTSSVTASVYATYIRYVHSGKIITPYFGLGIIIGFDHVYRSYYGYTDPGLNEWNLGPLGLFGVEWLPHPNIGINAEYNCSGFVSFGKGYTRTGKNPAGTNYKSTTKTFGYGFGQQSVRFGLSVYL